MWIRDSLGGLLAKVKEAAGFAALPVENVEPKNRAVPEHNSKGEPFSDLGIAPTKLLIDRVISPPMVELTRDSGFLLYTSPRPRDS